MNENEKKLNENNDETIVEQPSVEETTDIEKDILDEQTGENAREGETSSDDSPKEKDKKKLSVILAIVLALLIGGGVYGYSVNSENRKAEAQKNAFNDVTVEVKDEYSETIPLTTEETVLNTKDMVEVLKNGKADENTKITKADRETIDTSVEGGYTISYTVETLDSLGNKATKKYKKTFSVTNEDKEAPVITFKKTLVQINVGDKYDASDNIKSVKDAFEGDIKKVDAIPTEKGTSYYYVDSSKLDTSKAGDYTITVTASDKAGNAIHEDFTVKVNEKSSESADSTSKETKTTDKKSSSKSTNTSSSKSSTKTNTSSTSKTTTSNSGNTSTSNSSSNTSTNTNTSTKTQTCKEVDNGYNETYVTKEAWDETVVDQQAYDETVVTGSITVCNGCGAEFNSLAEYQAHRGTYSSTGDWSHGTYHSYDTTSTVHHDATYKTVHHDAEYGTRWVSKIETVCS